MPTPPEAPRLAHLLSRKAGADEDVARRLIDIPEVADETLGFHAQQAVEKLVKAVLVRNGVVYDRTHNIAYLGSAVVGNKVSSGGMRSALVWSDRRSSWQAST